MHATCHLQPTRIPAGCPRAWYAGGRHDQSPSPGMASSWDVGRGAYGIMPVALTATHGVELSLQQSWGEVAVAGVIIRSEGLYIWNYSTSWIYPGSLSFDAFPLYVELQAVDRPSWLKQP